VRKKKKKGKNAVRKSEIDNANETTTCYYYRGEGLPNKENKKDSIGGGETRYWDSLTLVVLLRLLLICHCEEM
jgi:hypothetical protein